MRIDAPTGHRLGGATIWFTGARLDDVEDANLAHHRPHSPRRLAAARAGRGRRSGTAPWTWHLMRQVHGDGVAVVTAATPVGAELRDVDAVVTDVPGRPLVVLAADCLPILIAGSRAVAAVHAGWRGLVADVVGRALDRLVTLGEDPARLEVGVGPAIGACCYVVGPEVAAPLGTIAPEAVVAREGGRPHVDLVAALRARLAARGVAPPRLVGPCARCGPGAWFSHRADPAAGRQAGLVVLGGGA